MPHVHNALHHFTRWQDAYRAALIEGDAGFTGVERAGETLTPIIDLWRLPEWLILRGDVSYSRVVSSAAVVAQFSGFELVNPAGSGVLAVVESIRPTVGDFYANVDSGGSIALNPVTIRGVANDTRYNQLGEVSACSLVAGDFNATAALPQDLFEAATRLEHRIAYVLRPGAKLFLLGTAENAAVGAVLQWRERLAGDTELARFGR